MPKKSALLRISKVNNCNVIDYEEKDIYAYRYNLATMSFSGPQALRQPHRPKLPAHLCWP